MSLLAASAFGDEVFAPEPLRAILVAASLLLAATLPAASQNATWSLNGTGDYNATGNWTPATVPTGTAFFDISNQNAVTLSATTSIGAWTFNTGASAYTFAMSNSLTFSGTGITINGGSAAINNSNGVVNFLNNSTAGSATITNVDNPRSFIFFGTSGGNDTATGGTATLINNGAILFWGKTDAANSTIINNTFGFVQFGSFGSGDTATAGHSTITSSILGTVAFNASSTAGRATITANGGHVAFFETSTGGDARFIINGAEGKFDMSGLTAAGMTAGSIEGSGKFFLGSANLALGSNNLSTTVNGVISDGGTYGGIGGSLTKVGTGTLTLAGTSNYTGGTNVNAGALQAGAVNAFSPFSAFIVAIGATLDLEGFNQTVGSLGGSGSVSLGAGTLATGNNNTDSVFSGSTFGSGGLTKIGSGIFVLSGANPYTGPTAVNGGILEVDGSIASSSLTSVAANATLTGNGRVGNTQVDAGGKFAPGLIVSPGTSMTVAGNLAFASGALYLVFINPATSSSANVMGTALLNGIVGANFATGTSVAKQYTILTAAGGVSGTFAGVDSLGLPSGFRASLSYDATHTYLDLALNFAPPSGSFSTNQQNVGNAIVNFFNVNGSIPPVWGGLTPAGLTQLSGEGATASQQAAFDAMSQFINLLIDPFIPGRGDSFSAGGGTTPYVDETPAYAAEKKQTDAFAILTKGSPETPFAQRWSVWAAGFGGSQHTDGNAVLGSNDTRSSIFGTAVGIDYRLSPHTLAGFALAGGGTSFSVNTLGNGRSDVFQAGAFVRHNIGPAYLTGALAYGWQNITTDRFVTVAGLDHLRAQFNANAWSGRVEGGYRFVVPVAGGVGITPYVAGQFVSFELPAYIEQAIVGGNQFALGYNAKTVSDTRSELGIRPDKSFATQDGIFILRGRLAWAHDYDPNRNILATFQTLPGASFVVNGATHAADSALTTVSAEWKWINGWSAAATFEGEFSNVTRSYAGKGLVRYTW